MNYFWAFVVGGGLCVVGQLLIDLTAMTPARVLVGYVTAGVALSALGLYGPLVDFAGAGATGPLCGFGWALTEGVRAAVARESGKVARLVVRASGTEPVVRIFAEAETARAASAAAEGVRRAVLSEEE